MPSELPKGKSWRNDLAWWQRKSALDPTLNLSWDTVLRLELSVEELEDFADWLRTDTEASPAVGTLELNVDLSGGQEDAAAIQAFAGAIRVNKSVQTLRFWCSHFGDAGGEVLADALRRNKVLQKLEFIRSR